jgi:hypothetical protein
MAAILHKPRKPKRQTYGRDVVSTSVSTIDDYSNTVPFPLASPSDAERSPTVAAMVTEKELVAQSELSEETESLELIGTQELDELHGHVDEIRDGIAYVVLVTKNGSTSSGNYPAKYLEKQGINEDDAFALRTVLYIYSTSMLVKLLFTKIDIPPLTVEENESLEKEIAADFEGLDFSENEAPN